MALGKIQKITVIGAKKSYQAILDELLRQGVVELRPFQSTVAHLGKFDPAIEYDLAQLEFAVRFLSNFPSSHPEQNAPDRNLPHNIQVTNEEITRTMAHFDYHAAVAGAVELEGAYNQLQNEIDRLRDEQQVMQRWEKLPIAPGGPRPASLMPLIVAVDTERFHALHEKVREIGGEQVEITTFDAEHALIYTHASFAPTIEQTVALMGLTLIDLSHITVVPRERLIHLAAEIADLESKKIQLELKGQQLAADLRALAIVYDVIYWQEQKKKAAEFMVATEYTFALQGWISATATKNLQDALTRIEPAIHITITDPEANDDVPVIYRNARLMEPFEAVTDLYGAPNANDPDPTPLLAPFFVLYFGFALTDAGYGLVLSGLSLLAIKMKWLPDSRKLLWVLFWGGVSAFILGAITGGWFSIDLNLFPPAIRDFFLRIRLIDPLGNPLLIFYISLVLGVIQVMFGLMVDMYWKAKHGMWYEIITGNGAWFTLFVGVAAWLSPMFNVDMPALVLVGKILVGAGLLCLVFVRGRETRNPFARLGSNLFNVYGGVNFFSDVLSYGRLLALALTTSIIGMVVNVMAGLSLQIPWVGWFVALLILIGGHSFNLGINALGAFIHSSRLQFIEFFPKFMTGGGRLFRPLVKRSKFIKITN